MNHESKQYLAMSKEFLLAAEIAFEQRLKSPTVSLAVHSAILAKDALLLREFGIAPRETNHGVATAELKSTGLVSSATVTQLSALLSAKNAAEYDAKVFSTEKAGTLLIQATRFVATIESLLGPVGTDSDPEYA